MNDDASDSGRLIGRTLADAHAPRWKAMTAEEKEKYNERAKATNVRIQIPRPLHSSRKREIGSNASWPSECGNASILSQAEQADAESSDVTKPIAGA